jgi:hypothetical protein
MICATQNGDINSCRVEEVDDEAVRLRDLDNGQRGGFRSMARFPKEPFLRPLSASPQAASLGEASEGKMRLPNHVFSLVQALHARNLALANGDDSARRALQKKIVETVVARHPSQGWGWKKASDTRPPSKDAIANNKLMPAHLISWDCFNGTTREPVQGESELIDGQVFIEVTGIDHLGGIVEPLPSVPAPATLPPREEFFAALTWLDGLYREQLDRANGVDLEGIAAHMFDVYLNARLAGASVSDAKNEVVKQINAILDRTDIHA